MDKNVEQFISYDKKSDSLYIFAKGGEEEQVVELVPGVNIELDRAGHVIGIEILKASRFFINLQKSKTSKLKASYKVQEPHHTYKTKLKSRRST